MAHDRFVLPVRRCAIPLMALLLTASPAGADRILLKNGNTVEGLVTRETESTVVLNLGSGDASFRRAQIRSIERDSAASNAVIEASWQDKYYLNRAYVPAGCEDLATLYRTLGERRRQAIEARNVLLKAGDAIHAIEQDLSGIQIDFDRANTELKAASPTNNTAAYNKLVAKNNQLRATLSLRHADLASELAARPGRMKTISAYLAALQDCSNAWAAVRVNMMAADSPDARTRRFMDKLAVQIRDYASDFQRIDVKSSLHGNSTVVAVLVNGRAWGNFIVDTGAEIVTVGRAFAERAGVNLAEGRPAGMIMANGTRIEATTVRLASVKVGGIDTPGVIAAVLPSSPGPDVDGLLGVNVLNSFLVRLDPSTGRLELEHFAPK
jgi:clan AA aspartic protease (TIGR02281 family)